MRIVLTHPYCWPYVRRGAERFIAELGRYLVARGHEVVTISTKPGAGTVEQAPEGRRILHRQVHFRGMERFRLQPWHPFLFAVLRTLSGLRADCVQSLFYTDAFAANWARKWRRHRTVFQITGPPVPYSFPRVPPDRWLFRQAILHADRRIVHSQFCRKVLGDYHGVDASVIPVPVDLNAFPYEPHVKRGRPVLLSVASFDAPYKGLRVLVKAFEILKQQLPDAVLRLSGQMSPRRKAEVIDALPEAVRRDVEVLGVGRLDDLARLYREASLTVLPSMWEAYGMVVVESWACGTPVCVAHHGGLPELLTDTSPGVSFDPQTDGEETMNAEGLAEAMLAGLSLAQDPQTPGRCRANAERYSWERLGGEYERLYQGDEP